MIERRGVPARPGKRRTGSKIARPLIMSLGVLTFLASGSYVAAAATATGSVRPQDWTRLDWAAVGTHYQLCIQEDGTSALGCMLTASAKPAAAQEPAAAPVPQATPYYSIAMIADTPAPTAKPPARRAAAPTPAAPAATAHPVQHLPSPTPGGGHGE